MSDERPIINIEGELVALGADRRDLLTTYQRWINDFETSRTLALYPAPISEEFEELSETDGRWHVVQYFERNRFELHPDYVNTYDEVMLGHLGREILIRRGWLTTPD